MPKIDIEAAPLKVGSTYPPPHDAPCAGRRRWKLGDAAGLDQFGVNLMRLPPGQWSSQRHWHSAEDEFVWVVEGEVVLVEDGEETVLRSGDCAGFKAGVANATTWRTARTARPSCWRWARGGLARTPAPIRTST